MERSLLRSTLLSLFAVVATFTATAQTPFTYTDMLMLDRISGLAVDPAGHYAVFNVRSTDMANNKGVSKLWLKDLTKPAEPEVQLGVSEGGAFDVQLSLIHISEPTRPY